MPTYNMPRGNEDVKYFKVDVKEDLEEEAQSSIITTRN